MRTYYWDGGGFMIETIYFVLLDGAPQQTRPQACCIEHIGHTSSMN